jgi:hypothetical protein
LIQLIIKPNVLMILVAKCYEVQSADDATYTQAQCAKIVITLHKRVQGCTMMRNVVTTYADTYIALTESPISKHRHLRLRMYETGTFFRKFSNICQFFGSCNSTNLYCL